MLVNDLIWEIPDLLFFSVNVSIITNLSKITILFQGVLLTGKNLNMIRKNLFELFMSIRILFEMYSPIDIYLVYFSLIY